MADATLRLSQDTRTQSNVNGGRGRVNDPVRGHDRDAAHPGTLGDEAAHLTAARHDPRAFAPVYEAYFPLIHAYCLRRLRDPEVAADATSQVFINAIQSLGRFRPDPKRPGSSFRSWLFSIAHNVVIDVVRRTRPHQSLDRATTTWQDDAPDLHDRLADADLTPEEWVLAAESRSELADLLETLPERQRTIVELRLAGLANAEIAEVLGISYPAVRSAQYRAFLELRRLLDPTRDSPSERPS
ncbi:MAG: sigma-70 family RNA polymerase sigma factor [Thermomicrobiales bacterium]